MPCAKYERDSEIGMLRKLKITICININGTQLHSSEIELIPKCERSGMVYILSNIFYSNINRKKR